VGGQDSQPYSSLATLPHTKSEIRIHNSLITISRQTRDREFVIRELRILIFECLKTPRA